MEPGEGSLPYIQGRGHPIDTADGGQYSILVPAPSREARDIVIVLSELSYSYCTVDLTILRSMSSTISLNSLSQQHAEL